MTVTRSMHVLAVPNLERSAAFYENALGFQVHEMSDPGWRMFVNGGCHIMAGECPDALPMTKLGDHSYVAYLIVDDVESYFSRVKAANVDIIKPLRSEPWGMREFGIRTIDGHRLMVGQEID